MEFILHKRPLGTRQGWRVKKSKLKLGLRASLPDPLVKSKDQLIKGHPLESEASSRN